MFPLMFHQLRNHFWTFLAMLCSFEVSAILEVDRATRVYDRFPGFRIKSEWLQTIIVEIALNGRIYGLIARNEQQLDFEEVSDCWLLSTFYQFMVKYNLLLFLPHFCGFGNKWWMSFYHEKSKSAWSYRSQNSDKVKYNKIIRIHW